MTDRDRAAVYAAEDQWSAALDRGGPMDFFGSHLLLPVQRRFGDLTAMQTYIDARCAEHPTAGPVAVRTRQGQTQAHYADGVIAIPVETTWACRESVLLHEFAHHLNRDADAHHGARYRAVMHALVESVLGVEAAFLLRTCYDANGVGLVA